jgi:hypothetical protein
MKDAIIVALLLMLALVGFGTSRAPEAAIQDTTRPLFHHAQQAVPDDARPILQRCYPVVPQSSEPVAAIGQEQEPVT